MESKFLGVCFLVSSVIIAAAILIAAYKPAADSQIGRYQFHPSTPPGVIWILDTQTGKVTTQSG